MSGMGVLKQYLMWENNKSTLSEINRFNLARPFNEIFDTSKYFIFILEKLYKIQIIKCILYASKKKKN